MQSLHMCSRESGQDELLKGISDNMVLNSETEDGIKLKEDLCKQNANLVAASRVGKSVFVFMESEYRSDNGIFLGTVNFTYPRMHLRLRPRTIPVCEEAGFVFSLDVLEAAVLTLFQDCLHAHLG